MTLLVVLLGEALADTITLESGAALEGTLTHYEIHGSCNIRVEEGGLAGANVVLPCSQVIRMERRAVVQSGPTTLDGSVIIVPEEQEVAPVEEIAAPLLELAPMTVAEDLSGANVGVEPESMVVPLAVDEVAAAEVAAEPAAAEPLPPASTPEEETPVAAVSPQEQAAPKEEPEPTVAEASPQEPAPAEEPESKAEAAPEKTGPFDRITWPKIRLDR